jgi:hypothetical protein
MPTFILTLSLHVWCKILLIPNTCRQINLIPHFCREINVSPDACCQINIIPPISVVKQTLSSCLVNETYPSWLPSN